MEKKLAKTLLEKYRDNTCTAEEQEQVDAWYTIWNEDEEGSYLSDEQLNAAVKRVYKTLLIKRPIPLWKPIAFAAAAVAAITLSIWIYTSQHPDTLSSQTIGRDLVNDIAPGKNTATLTLANGKKIKLSAAKTGIVIAANKLSYNDGSTILSSRTNDLSSGANAKNLDPSEVGMTNVSTPRGGTYQITLPDGTKVWLNAASSIIFPSTLSHSASHQRRVELVGEAYFEVSKDKKHPFIVSSKGQQVEVLGTHFNINAYEDEGSIKTTLLEGSLRVSSLSYNNVILKPNQQATNTGGNIHVKQMDPNEAVAWKNSYFQFNDTPLETVMRQIARWYDVEIIYKNETAKSAKFGGTIARDHRISQILAAITKTGEVEFKIEGKTIIVQ
ncbi:FecR family protein [Pedobacter heparinus]|uniref:FecR family protein n=1 Tax=Pedobacter heparinus TaxID=984 RepID=UPI002930FD89|nr:FecR domain-containing protein [Pedobacter heparinus]